jgi:PAS domain S-box-containing protein
MRTYADWPILRKIAVANTLTAVVALLLAMVAALVGEMVTFNRSLLSSTATLAAVGAANSTAALAFKDQREAEAIIAGLASSPDTLSVALYDAAGRRFASYPAEAGPPSVALPPVAGHEFQPKRLIVWHPAEQAGSVLGLLMIERSRAGLRDRLVTYGAMAAIIFIASIITAGAVSRALQRGIAGPILGLAETARSISRTGRYSIRAEKVGNDELGQLTDTFNEMLAKIEEQNAALAESEGRLRLAMEAAQIGTWSWNMESDELLWSESMAEIFGLDPQRPPGTGGVAWSCVFDEDRKALEHAFRASIREDRDCRVRFRIRRPDGNVRHLEGRGKPFAGDSGIRMVGVAVDLTDLMRAQEGMAKFAAELEQRVAERTAELEAANREMEAFTYSVSHDLRAPLRHISGFAEVLESDYRAVLPSEALHYLQRISRNSHQMSELINDLLALSRVGKQDINRQTVAIDQITKEIVADASASLSQRQIQWKIGELPAACCDPILIRQVLVNLISNALKYSRLEPLAVIEIGSETNAAGEVVYYVADNGVGFDMAYVGKLFQLFSRLHRAEDFEGTGLGLATVDRIVRRHGGRVWAQAEEGRGARFSFTLGLPGEACEPPALM